MTRLELATLTLGRSCPTIGPHPLLSGGLQIAVGSANLVSFYYEAPPASAALIAADANREERVAGIEPA